MEPAWEKEDRVRDWAKAFLDQHSRRILATVADELDSKKPDFARNLLTLCQSMEGLVLHGHMPEEVEQSLPQTQSIIDSYNEMADRANDKRLDPKLRNSWSEVQATLRGLMKELGFNTEKGRGVRS